MALHIVQRDIPSFRPGTPFRKHIRHHVHRAVAIAVKKCDGRRGRRPERADFLSTARQSLAHAIGHTPTDHELAEYLQINERDIIKALTKPEVHTECLAWCQDRDRFESLIEGLPTDRQVLLRMHYLHGHTEQEIARILGLSQAAVHKRLAVAEKLLGGRL